MNCWTDPTLVQVSPCLHLWCTAFGEEGAQAKRDAQALKAQGYPGPRTALKFTSVHKNTYIYQYILYHLTYNSKSPINKWNNPKKSCISFLALVSPSVTRAPCFAERLGESHLSPSAKRSASHLCEMRSGDAIPATQAAREGSVRVPVLSPQPYAQQGLEVPCATRMVSIGTERSQTLLGEAHLCAGTAASANAQIQVHSFLSLVNNNVKSNFLKLLESKLKNKTFYTSHFSELEKVTLNKSPKATLEMRDKALLFSFSSALYTTRKRVQPSTNTASLLSSRVLPCAEYLFAEGEAKATQVLGVPSEIRATGSSRPNTGGPLFFPYRKSFLCYWLLPFVGFVSNLTSLESFASLELRFQRNSQATQGVSHILCWYPHTRFHISSLASPSAKSISSPKAKQVHAPSLSSSPCAERLGARDSASLISARDPATQAFGDASEETKVQEDAINQTLNSFRASPRSTENIRLSHHKYVASKIKEEVGQEVKIYCQHYLNSLKTYLNNIDILCSSSAYATHGAESLGASKDKPSDTFNSLSTQVIAPSLSSSPCFAFGEERRAPSLSSSPSAKRDPATQGARVTEGDTRDSASLISARDPATQDKGVSTVLGKSLGQASPAYLSSLERPPYLSSLAKKSNPLALSTVRGEYSPLFPGSFALRNVTSKIEWSFLWYPIHSFMNHNGILEHNETFLKLNTRLDGTQPWTSAHLLCWYPDMCLAPNLSSSSPRDPAKRDSAKRDPATQFQRHKRFHLSCAESIGASKGWVPRAFNKSNKPLKFTLFSETLYESVIARVCALPCVAVGDTRVTSISLAPIDSVHDTERCDVSLVSPSVTHAPYLSVAGSLAEMRLAESLGEEERLGARLSAQARDAKASPDLSAREMQRERKVLIAYGDHSLTPSYHFPSNSPIFSFSKASSLLDNFNQKLQLGQSRPLFTFAPRDSAHVFEKGLAMFVSCTESLFFAEGESHLAEKEKRSASHLRAESLGELREMRSGDATKATQGLSAQSLRLTKIPLGLSEGELSQGLTYNNFIEKKLLNPLMGVSAVSLIRTASESLASPRETAFGELFSFSARDSLAPCTFGARISSPKAKQANTSTHSKIATGTFLPKQFLTFAVNSLFNVQNNLYKSPLLDSHTLSALAGSLVSPSVTRAPSLSAQGVGMREGLGTPVLAPRDSARVSCTESLFFAEGEERSGDAITATREKGTQRENLEIKNDSDRSKISEIKKKEKFSKNKLYFLFFKAFNSNLKEFARCAPLTAEGYLPLVPQTMVVYDNRVPLNPIASLQQRKLDEGHQSATQVKGTAQELVSLSSIGSPKANPSIPSTSQYAETFPNNTSSINRLVLQGHSLTESASTTLFNFTHPFLTSFHFSLNKENLTYRKLSSLVVSSEALRLSRRSEAFNEDNLSGMLVSLGARTEGVRKLALPSPKAVHQRCKRKLPDINTRLKTSYIMPVNNFISKRDNILNEVPYIGGLSIAPYSRSERLGGSYRKTSHLQETNNLISDSSKVRILDDFFSGHLQNNKLKKSVSQRDTQEIGYKRDKTIKNHFLNYSTYLKIYASKVKDFLIQSHLSKKKNLGVYVRTALPFLTGNNSSIVSESGSASSLSACVTESSLGAESIGAQAAFSNTSAERRAPKVQGASDSIDVLRFASHLSGTDPRDTKSHKKSFIVLFPTQFKRNMVFKRSTHVSKIEKILRAYFSIKGSLDKKFINSRTLEYALGTQRKPSSSHLSVLLKATLAPSLSAHVSCAEGIGARKVTQAPYLSVAGSLFAEGEEERLGARLSLTSAAQGFGATPKSISTYIMPSSLSFASQISRESLVCVAGSLAEMRLGESLFAEGEEEERLGAPPSSLVSPSVTQAPRYSSPKAKQVKGISQFVRSKRKSREGSSLVALDKSLNTIYLNKRTQKLSPNFLIKNQSFSSPVHRETRCKANENLYKQSTQGFIVLGSDNVESKALKKVSERNFLEKISKEIQLRKYNKKKRRIKKLKKETRHRKKRKRFYPRPIWIRYNIYSKFLKHRYFKLKKKFQKKLFLRQSVSDALKTHFLHVAPDLKTGPSLAPASVNFWKDRTQRAQELRDINMSFYARDTKIFFRVSNTVINDFKRLLWKSYWLRSNFYPYLKKMKESLNEIKQSTQSWELYYTLKSFMNELGGFTQSSPSSLAREGISKQAHKKESISSINSTKWQKALYFSQYNSITYQRLQQFLSQIRENLTYITPEPGSRFASLSLDYVPFAAEKEKSSPKAVSRAGSLGARDERSAESQGTLRTVSLFAEGGAPSLSSSPSAKIDPATQASGSHLCAPNISSSPKAVSREMRDPATQASSREIRSAEAQVKSFETPLLSRNLKVRTQATKSLKMSKDMVTLQNFSERSQGTSGFAGAMASRHPATFEKVKSNAPREAPDFWMNLGKTIGRFSLMTPFYSFTSFGSKGNLGSKSYQVDTALASGVPSYFMDKAFLNFASDSFSQSTSSAYLGVSDSIAVGTRDAQYKYNKKNLYLEPFIRMCWAFSKTFSSSMTEYNKRAEVWGNERNRTQTKNNKTKKFLKNFSKKWHTFLNEQYELCQLDCLQVKGRGLEINRLTRDGIRLGIPAQDQGALSLISREGTEGHLSRESPQATPARAVGEQRYKIIFNKTRQKEEKLQFYIGSAGLDKVWGNQDSPRDVHRVSLRRRRCTESLGASKARDVESTKGTVGQATRAQGLFNYSLSRASFAVGGGEKSIDVHSLHKLKKQIQKSIYTCVLHRRCNSSNTSALHRVSRCTSLFAEGEASAKVGALQRDARGTLGISLFAEGELKALAFGEEVRSYTKSILNKQEFLKYNNLTKKSAYWWSLCEGKGSTLDFGFKHQLHKKLKNREAFLLDQEEGMISLGQISAPREGLARDSLLFLSRESPQATPAFAAGYPSTLETDKTIISVFLFHFCSFISLISFAQIRTLLKFYYLGFSKLFDFSSFLIRFSFFGVQALQAHLISLTYSERLALFNNRRRDIENKGSRQRISRPSLVFASLSLGAESHLISRGASLGIKVPKVPLTESNTCISRESLVSPSVTRAPCTERLGARLSSPKAKQGARVTEGDMQSAWQKSSTGALRMARLSMTTQGPFSRYLRDKSKIVLRRQSPQALHWTRMVDAIESLSSRVASLGSSPRASAPVLANYHARDEKEKRNRERCQASQQNFYYYKKSLKEIFLRKMFKKGLGANTNDYAFLGYSPIDTARDSNGYLSTLAPTALGQEQRISRLCRFHCFAFGEERLGARHVRRETWRREKEKSSPKASPSLSLTQVLGHLSRESPQATPAQRIDISRQNLKESLDFPLTTRDSELKTLTLFFLLKNLHFLFYCFYYISFGITKNFISILKETTGFVFGLLPRSLYTFFEKPGELIVDWIAYSFLVEWAADLTNLIPENVDVLFATSSFKMLRFLNSVSFLTNLATLFSFSHSYQIQSKFLLSGSVLESFSFLNIGSLFLQRRLYHLYEIFIMQFFQPDMDIIIRHKKGLIFWDIWGDFLMQVAENSNINISELTSLKEEQFKLLESGAEALFEPKSILAPISNKSRMWETSFGNQVKDTARSLDKNGLRNFLPESFLKQISQRSIQSREKNESLKVKKQLAHKNLKASSHLSLSKTTRDAMLGRTQVLASPGLASLSQGLRGTPRDGQTSSLFAFGEVGQFLSYQGKDTELFIDLYPPKSFTRLNFLKNNESLQPTVGSLVCQIHAGLLLKQVSKNVLVVSAVLSHQPSSLSHFQCERSGRDSRNSNKSTEHGLSLAKTLLIQAIAGETELKIITDNAYRYSLVYRGVAVGIKLLKEVFDSLALHTPCLFLMEDIHAIGSRRPLLISDDDTLKATEGSITGSQREEIHEKNQVLYQLSKHMITHYKKPYKGDFSLLIPTNHFCFDILRSNVFSSARDSLDSSSAYIDTKDKGSYNQLSVQEQGARFGASAESHLISRGASLERRHSFATVNGFQNKTVLPIISSQKMNNQASSLSPRGSEDRDSDKQGLLSGKKEVHSRLLMKSSELLAPPATSPFSVLTLKEEKKFQTLKDVIEMPWSSLPGEQLAQVLKSSYSIRVKVALLADAAMSSLSVKLDMITDLLVIIDSVKGNRGFVVFATTHIPFVLDPALRRPGRLDETIILDTTRLPSITFSPLAKQVAGTLSKEAHLFSSPKANSASLAPSLSAQAWGTQGKTGEILAPRDTVGVPKEALLAEMRLAERSGEANVRNVDNIHNFRWEILNSYFKVFKGCFCASGSPSKPSPSFESSLHSLSFLMMTSPKVELAGFARTGVHSNAARLASFAQEGVLERPPCDVSACASESSPRVAAGDTKVVQAALKKSLSAILEKSSLFNIKRLAICKSHSRKLLSLVYFRASNLFYNNFIAYAPVTFISREGLLISAPSLSANSAGLLRYPSLGYLESCASLGACGTEGDTRVAFSNTCAGSIGARDESATLAQALLPSVCNNTQPSEAFLSFYSVSAMSSPLAFSRAKNARVAIAPRDAQLLGSPSGAPLLSTTRDSQEGVRKLALPSPKATCKLPRGPGASPKASLSPKANSASLATPILNNVIKSYINYLISGKFGEMFFIHDETIKSNILLSYNAKNSESYFSIPLFHLLAVVKNIPFSQNSLNHGGPSYLTKDSQVGQLSSDNSQRYAALLSPKANSAPSLSANSAPSLSANSVPSLSANSADVSLSSPLSRKKQLMINKVPKLSIVSSTRLVLCTQLTSLILSFIQKRYIYYQNLIVPEFLYFVNKSSFFEPLSPPTSNILLPARRYENYRRSFAYYYLSLPFMKRTVQINNNIIDKINLHQQQRLVKRLYHSPVKETFKSEFSHYISTNQNANVNRERSEATNGKSEAQNLTNFSNATLMIGSLSASLNFNNNTNKVFRHRILLRHRNYLTNQWWNGQLPEHNAETTFLSDIDWRYTFMESVGDLLLDFPDAEQHYNPQNRRWLLTKGSFNFWFDFEKCIYSEFYSHLIFDCFLNLFHLYEKHRDILDYYAFYVLNKGQDNKAISFKNQQMVATGEEIERISLSLRFNSFL